MMRTVATCVVWQPIPSLPGSSGQKPWHAAFLEVHLMGIERGMFRGDLLSGRFNHAALMEFIYSRMGLVSRFSLN